MNCKSVSVTILGLAAVCLLAAAGCNTTYGPRFGIFAYPIPVSPYLQDMEEDRFWEHERYNRVPVLEPLVPGGPTTALDEPSDDEVMRALERARPTEGGLPLLHEVQRNNVQIRKELIADYVDPVRVYPLIGPAQLHHCRWKCTVYFSEVTRVGWPIPYTTKNEDAQEVIYIDHDHLHMVGNVDAGPGSPGASGPATVPVSTPASASATPPSGVRSASVPAPASSGSGIWPFRSSSAGRM